MDLMTAIGFDGSRRRISRDPFLLEYVNLKLAALGEPIVGDETKYPFMRLAKGLLGQHREQARLLAGHHCPADRRIQAFIDRYVSAYKHEGVTPRLPDRTLILDRHGMARVLSLPPDSDEFYSDIISSYRTYQGVLHNPKADRRTTKGSFHVAEGGLAIAGDKLRVPQRTYALMLQKALQPPQELMRLPFTANQPEPAHTWVSLLMRPLVCPEIPGFIAEKRYEVRFFVPGNMVANLDFVETIFGNAGDPYLQENDAGADVTSWTGHSGAVILAPHLLECTKKELGLPHVSEASEKQKAQGMCWESEDEKYNNGTPFKITARDDSGCVVTVITDNYFGYCKKEVKTQISFVSNLYGLAEEEHAGGAVAYASYDLGEDFRLARFLPDVDHQFDDAMKLLGDSVEVHDAGYAIDKTYPDITYVPDDAFFSLSEQKITWERGGKTESLRLQPSVTYVLPSGYKVEMVRPHEGRRWRLIGTTAEGAFCHKPCTVSGGGKSEISKSLADAIIHGAVFVNDFERDFDLVEEILNKDYSQRYEDDSKNRSDSRPILSPERSLGSVIKLLTPAPEYTDEYNEWLRGIPYSVKELVFIVKRFYKPDWGSDWRGRFSVDYVNGTFGNELKYRDQKLITQYLRVGFTDSGAWRVFGLRKDFMPAAKLQMEDDITASCVVPAERIKGLAARNQRPSVKISQNCEFRLFQRPDDAIHRGYDKRTESDMSQPGCFLSNYEPLDKEVVDGLTKDVLRFEQYTEPVKDMVRAYLEDEESTYIVTPAHPRIVDGKPTKNPRYLQDRDDLVDPRSYYLGDLGARMFRRIPKDEWLPQPVDAVLPGRRNNPPQEGIRPLAAHNPIHYLPLPEFFMEVVTSMTGKSPSTTGAGSEGALTKGPFNMLLPISDLNAALVSFIVCGYSPFLTAAGYVGPHYRTDHDVSLLIPEVWCRMFPEEREPDYLIEKGMLERCEDFEHNGRSIAGSILGYRINDSFVRHFFGRIFANPDAIFPEEMLKPELQDMDVFVDTIDNMMGVHQRVAKLYFEDGSIDGAIPPLKALLHIMADGDYEGKTLASPEVRALFDRDAMIASDWYNARLDARHGKEIAIWERRVSYLESLQQGDFDGETEKKLDLANRIAGARQRLEEIKTEERRKALVGTIGLDPMLR